MSEIIAEKVYTKEGFVHDIVDKLKKLPFQGGKEEDTEILNSTISYVAKQYKISNWALHLNSYHDPKDDKTHISGHEWLYDMVCYRYGNDHYTLCDTILVMESEWKGKRYSSEGNDGDDRYGEVKFDFQKLLLSNSDIKLMVFQQHDGKNYDDLKKYFKERIDNYRQGNDSDYFLFACYLQPNNGKRECSVCSYSRGEGWKEI